MSFGCVAFVDLSARVAVRGRWYILYSRLTYSHAHQGMIAHGNNRYLLDFCGIASGVLICVGLMCASPHVTVM